MRDLSLCVPTWVRILSLQKCSSGRGDTIEKQTGLDGILLLLCLYACMHVGEKDREDIMMCF